MQIRKISIGADYKSNAMHYIVGQGVLGGSYSIHVITIDPDTGKLYVWIEKGDEVLLWKAFNAAIPVSIEYNINF